MTSKRVDFTFSKDSLIYLMFSKKKCPNCEASKMNRVVREDFVGEGESIRVTHFGDKPDSYSGTIFYKCPECGCVYQVEELVNATPKRSSDIDLIPVSTKSNESNKNKEKSKGTKRFFDIVGLVMILMILNGAISDNNISVAIVFIPIIVVFWLISRLMFK